MRLIDADALIEWIDENVSEHTPSALVTKAVVIYALKSKNVAPTVGGWISVKDRMPEKSGEYLCWFGANKVAIGPAILTYVDEWKAFGRLQSLEKYPNITHWMPLQEPPEVEA